MSDVFLAYSRHDRRIMESIREYLRVRNIDVWTDEHLSPNTPNYDIQIQNVIDSCGGLIFLMSPYSNDKDSYALNELTYAINTGKVVYPVIIAGNEKNAVPLRLQSRQWYDLRGKSQKSPDEVLNRLTQDIGSDLNIKLKEPPARVEIHGNVYGDVNVAGGNIITNISRFFSTPQAKWITALGVLASIVTILGLTFTDAATLLFQNTSSSNPNETTPSQEEDGISAFSNSDPKTESISEDEPSAATTVDIPEIAFTGVSQNSDWPPLIESFNGVQMALVPAGCFMMGNDTEDDDEKPAHEVCFEDPYWIDFDEVTNGQFEAMNGVASQIGFSGTDIPRNLITWDEANIYCESRGARLPTEAEWEYAARGPANLKYPWGDEFIGNNVVYGSNADNEISVVGSREGGRSWVGTYDMIGNVWEWVGDWYDETYYLNSIRINPQGPRVGERRVIKGGSWDSVEQNLSTHNRFYAAPNFADRNIGFRCARDLDGTAFNQTNTEQEASVVDIEDIPEIAFTGVSQNADWTPIVQDFGGVEMALVPTSCFMMGSEDGDENEQPIHEVCFNEPFWIDVYEVTNEQFGSIGCEEQSSQPRQPRNCVTWEKASSHCENREAHLPTEAEWEYAARGPDGLTYPWGNDFDASKVVKNGDNDVTAPVGSRSSGRSWVGANDMSGNVWEWVADWYDDEYYSVSPSINPKGPDSGTFRVLRGGVWTFFSTSELRSSTRLGNSSATEHRHFGFRCARNL